MKLQLQKNEKLQRFVAATCENISVIPFSFNFRYSFCLPGRVTRVKISKIGRKIDLLPRSLYLWRRVKERRKEERIGSKKYHVYLLSVNSRLSSFRLPLRGIFFLSLLPTSPSSPFLYFFFLTSLCTGKTSVCLCKSPS